MEQSSPNNAIAIKNAGLVILNSYLPMLFDRLGITNEKRFTNAQTKSDAVFYLQYLATGTPAADEAFLPLNKVLCGMPLSSAVSLSAPLNENQKEIIEGLLAAAISHWPSIGDATTIGFQGNWLIRDGILTEHDDKWVLQVDKRAYDLLLNKSPFTFSIIHYPWMPKPLHVMWPY